MGATAPVLMEIQELGLKGEPLLTVDKWDVCEMKLSWEKIALLWKRLEEHKSLFSDLTRGDFDNYVRLLMQPNSYWLEVYEDEELCGIVYFEGLESSVEAYIHVVMLDRRSAEKLPVYDAIIKHMFSEFPLNRISCVPAANYYGTIRTLKKLGFKQEGIKRDAMLLHGRWIDAIMLGILRSEVTGVISIR